VHSPEPFLNGAPILQENNQKINLRSKSRLAVQWGLYPALSNGMGYNTEGVVTGDTNWGGVFGMRYSGGRILGFEPSIGFSPNFLDSSVSALDAQGNLILNFPLPGFTPYATVGAGLVGSWGDSVKSVGTKFAINYGGGVKLRNLAGPIGIRFDLRGYTTTNAFGGDSSFAKQNVNFLEGTIGLLFSF
jgi:hypothetical protein